MDRIVSRGKSKFYTNKTRLKLDVRLNRQQWQAAMRALREADVGHLADAIGAALKRISKAPAAPVDTGRLSEGGQS